MVSRKVWAYAKNYREIRVIKMYKTGDWLRLFILGILLFGEMVKSINFV